MKKQPKGQIDPSVKQQKEHISELKRQLRKAKLRLQHTIDQRRNAAKHKVRTISAKGIDLIAEFEGCVLECYNDSAGNATIGIGHLIHLGRVTAADTKKWGKITVERAYDLMRGDAQEAVQTIKEKVSVPLNQNQFDALVSFIFNVGAGNFTTSTLLRRLNDGDYAGVPSEMNRWVSDGNKQQPGLVRRRAAEGKLFSKGA